MNGNTSIARSGEAAAAVVRCLGSLADVAYAEAVLTVPRSVAAAVAPERIDPLRGEIQAAVQASGARHSRTFLLVNPATVTLRLSLHCLVTWRETDEPCATRLHEDVRESLRAHGSSFVPVDRPRLGPAPEAATLLDGTSSPTHRIDVTLEQLEGGPR